MAGQLALQGFEAILLELPQFQKNIEGIRSRGGIEVKVKEGVDLPSGFGRLTKITNNVEEAVKEADVLCVVAPSFAHEVFAKACGPHLRDGQVVLVHPGNPGGGLVFSRIWKGKRAKGHVILAEAPSLFYACRKTNPSRVEIQGYKKHFKIAALPAKHTETVLKVLREPFPEFEAEKNAFAVEMSNPNTIVHPPPALLNAGWIEMTKGGFLFYRQGVTQATARIIEALDKERLAIGKALGVLLTPVKDLLLRWYGHLGAKGETTLEVLNNNPVYQGSMAPESLQERYVAEDVPYGLVPMAAFGKLVSVRTPTTDLMIQLACQLTGIDFLRQGRTLEAMGLLRKTPDEIRRLYGTGE